MINKSLSFTIRFSVMLGLGMLLAGCIKEEPKISSLMPQQLDSRIKIKAGEQIRETLYFPGTSIKKEALVNFKEGETGEYTYYADGPSKGKLKHAKIYAKAPEGAERGALKREVELAPDERTLIKDLVYHDNGNLKREADLLSDKVFESREADKHGRLIAFQRYSKHYISWALTQEQLFWADSSPRRVLVLNDDDLSGTIDEFSPEHQLVSHAVVGSYGMRIVTDLYLADGVTVYKRVTQTANVKVENLLDGQVSEEFRFYGSFGALDYTRFSHGVPVLHQQWLARNNSSNAQKGTVTIADFYLSMIEIFDAKGQVLKRYVLNKDSVMPSQIAERNEGAAPSKVAGYAPGRIRTFGADGTLRNEVVLDDKDALLSQRDYKPEDEIMAPSIPEELLVAPSFDAPPASLKNGEMESEDGIDH